MFSNTEEYYTRIGLNVEVVHHDLKLADEFITKLSQVYRYVIDYNESKEVQVIEELKFSESYFFLLQVRFQEKIELQIADDLYKTKKKILPLSIQLLI